MFASWVANSFSPVYDPIMKKTEAIALLGGTTVLAAKACRVTRSAVSLWPGELTNKQEDRVQAALYRRLIAKRRPKPTTKSHVADAV